MTSSSVVVGVAMACGVVAVHHQTRVAVVAVPVGGLGGAMAVERALLVTGSAVGVVGVGVAGEPRLGVARPAVVRHAELVAGDSGCSSSSLCCCVPLRREGGLS